MNNGPAGDPADAVVLRALAIARAAGAHWAATPIATRLQVIAATRRLLVTSAAKLASTVLHLRPVAETLVAELLPLIEAARFLERKAAALLAPRRLRSGRPLWLFGVRAELLREPAGVVLILAPSNYPLFLPGVQILQAIAAGNTVCVKPAPGGEAAMQALAETLKQSGLPDGVLQLLPSEAETGAAAVRGGFDHIVLTGSSQTGRRVLVAAAEQLTPATVELSGNDAVFVLPGADLDLVARSLAYGLRLNGSATCIAPRRVFVTAADAARLEQRLLPLLAAIPPAKVTDAVRDRLAQLLREAASAGSRVIGEAASCMSPAIVADAHPGLRLLREDVFAPVLSIVPVTDMDQALMIAAGCRHALGSSIFGDAAAARRFAPRVRSGSVVVNDVIVPTADPRLSFGGRGESGYGTTRGAAGLLELTRIKTVSTRSGSQRPHLRPASHMDERNHLIMIMMLHGTTRDRWRALVQLVWQRA